MTSRYTQRKRWQPRAIAVSIMLGVSMLSGVVLAQSPTAEPATNPDAPAPSEQPAPTTPSPSPSPTPASPPPVAELVPPSLIHDVQPTYPEAAEQEGLAATVVFQLDIDAQGSVEAARIAQPSEHPGRGFEEAALEAVKQLRFSPATEAGVPIAVTIGYRVRFVPDVRQTPTPTAVEPAPAPKQATKEKRPEPPPVTGQLSGALLERGTRLPLAGVKITAFRGEGDAAEGYETETDAAGNFRLTGLRVGKWRVLADPDGYYPLRTTETVKKDQRTDVRYFIERNSYNPYDVEIDTKRVRREVNHISVDARQAERIPGTFGDVLAVVNNFPGVARAGGAGFGSSGLVIRGSSPKDSRILISSVDVPLLYHFGDLRSVLPVGMIEKIDFYPGNFSVEYGRATGGIVDVDLKDLNPRKFGGYADANFFDASLYLEVPITDEFAVAVAGRRSYIDVLLEAALPDSGNSLAAPRYYDYQFLASYRPSPAHQLQTFFFVSDDEFRILFEDPLAADAEVVITDVGFGTHFYRGIAEYKYVPSQSFQNELKLSFGKDLSGFNVGELITVDSTLHQGQVKDTARVELSDQFALRGGVDYVFQKSRLDARLPELPREGDGNVDIDFTDTRDTNTSDTAHSTAGFAELEFRPWENTLVLPGVRLDHFGRTGQFAFSPRLTLRHDLNDEWSIKGGVGLFQQEPTFDETDEVLGNPDLEPEKAMHYSAGFEYRPLPYASLDVTGFYKTMHDLVGRSDELVVRDGETVPLNYNNQASGRAYGLTVSARHELADKFFGWLAYTWSRSERKDPGQDDYRLFDFDQTHILTLIGGYRLPRNWEISSRFRYVTGNLYTPVTGSVYDSDADRYRAISGSVNSARVDGFHQLDIRIDKRWVYQTWMLNAYLDIQNVYNRTNVNNLQYNYDYSDTETQQTLPIIPVLGLRGEF